MPNHQVPEYLTGLEISERSFFDKGLLSTEYARRYREAYTDTRYTAFLNPHRNYRRLLDNLSAVFEYNAEHARSFAKRLKAQAADFNSCEAVFAEVIVYYHHLPLISEGYVQDLRLEGDECDLIVHRHDGTSAFLEVMSLMPDLRQGADGLTTVLSHTQKALSSVRQKLLHKIKNQGQLSAQRENWAVIELNDIRIAGQFTVLASLSDGYKVRFDADTLEVTGEGYDWSRSVFHEPGTEFLKGIISFDLGNYPDRRVLLNPHYGRA